MIKTLGTGAGVIMIMITNSFMYKIIGCLMIIGFMMIPKKKHTFTRTR